MVIPWESWLLLRAFTGSVLVIHMTKKAQFALQNNLVKYPTLKINPHFLQRHNFISPHEFGIWIWDFKNPFWQSSRGRRRSGRQVVYGGGQRTQCRDAEHRPSEAQCSYDLNAMALCKRSAVCDPCNMHSHHVVWLGQHAYIPPWLGMNVYLQNSGFLIACT